MGDGTPSYTPLYTPDMMSPEHLWGSMSPQPREMAQTLWNSGIVTPVRQTTPPLEDPTRLGTPHAMRTPIPTSSEGSTRAETSLETLVETPWGEGSSRSTVRWRSRVQAAATHVADAMVVLQQMQLHHHGSILQPHQQVVRL